jgi:hypothetical protein
MSKCNECGCDLAKGAKFCSECGCKIQTEENNVINWDSPFSLTDGSFALTDEQMSSVAFSLNGLTLSADINRVVLHDSQVFKDKLIQFKKIYSQRLGDVEGKKEMLKSMDDSIGFIDFGDGGLGRRGTLFARVGIFYITKEYPKVVDDEPVGGFVPWKLFYKFGKPRNEKCYCLVDWNEVLSSSEVDEDVKENCGKTDGISKFFFINTGLSKKEIDECMNEIKSGLSGDEAEPAYEDFENEEEFEED